MNLKKLMDQHRVKAGFIGGALVVSSAWGTCQFVPEVPTEEEAVEAPAEPEPEAPPAEEEEAKAEEADAE